LPNRFPVGTRYVVEGRGGADGEFFVRCRYVVFPDGRHIDLSTEAATTPRARLSAAMRRVRLKKGPRLSRG
jgi:hypothetical protein